MAEHITGAIDWRKRAQAEPKRIPSEMRGPSASSSSQNRNEAALSIGRSNIRLLPKAQPNCDPIQRCRNLVNTLLTVMSSGKGKANRQGKAAPGMFKNLDGRSCKEYEIFDRA
jgi:hypothetical protein